MRKQIRDNKAGLSCPATVEMASIIFYAITIAKFLDHFQIKLRALLKALGLYEFVFPFKKAQLLCQLFADILASTVQIITGTDKVAGRINHGFGNLSQDLACQRINLFQAFQLVTEKFQAQGLLVFIGRNNLKGITT